MAGQYVGFKVELTSSQLGKIVGTVSEVAETKIELDNATINDQPPVLKKFSAESRFIQDIRILSTTSGGDSSESDTQKKNKTKSASTRSQRRDWLRNIPNAYSAYVCPDSPPLIHKTIGAPTLTPHHYSNTINNNSSSPKTSNSIGLQQIDNALAKVSIKERNNNERSHKFRSPVNQSKRRSYSMSETAVTVASDVSGTESDSFHHQHHPHYHHHNYRNVRGQSTSNNSNNMNNNNNNNSNTANTNSRHQLNRSHLRAITNCNCNGSNNNNTNTCCNNNNNNSNNSRSGFGKHNCVDWDQIRVEEFIDEDFDFEGNLALFNKSAFYEMVDLKEGNNIVRTTVASVINKNSCVNKTKVAVVQTQNDSQKFIEGPDGVGTPLFTGCFQSCHTSFTPSSPLPSSSSQSSTVASTSITTIVTNSSHNSHSNMISQDHVIYNTLTTNTATTASSKQPTHLSMCSSSANHPITTDEELNNLSSDLKLNKSNESLNKSVQRYWYTSTNQRVPILSNESRQNLLHYLTTGIDLTVADKYSSISNSSNHGITWGRLIETSTRSMADCILTYLRNTNRTPQRVIHRPPVRILVLPTGSHLGGALSLTLARHLSVRGACVLLCCPTLNSIQDNDEQSQTNSDSHHNSANISYPNSTLNPMSNIYRTELDLLLHLSPKPNQYGLEEDDFGEISFDDDGNDEDDTDYNDNDEEVEEKELSKIECAEINEIIDANDYTNQVNESLKHNTSKSISLTKSELSINNKICTSNRTTDLINFESQSDLDNASQKSDTILSSTNHSHSNQYNSNHNIVDYSPVGRMWMSRMPGLKLLRKPNAITKLPSNMLIDLVIIGHNPEQTDNQINNTNKIDSRLLYWLTNHSALNLIVHLTPCSNSIITNSQNNLILSNAQQNWIMELGLPILSAIPKNVDNSSTITHFLVDIGLGRNLVRRLIGDLKFLPPYGLFDTGSVISLRSDPIQSNVINRS